MPNNPWLAEWYKRQSTSLSTPNAPTNIGAIADALDAGMMFKPDIASMLNSILAMRYAFTPDNPIDKVHILGSLGDIVSDPIRQLYGQTPGFQKIAPTKVILTNRYPDAKLGFDQPHSFPAERMNLMGVFWHPGVNNPALRSTYAPEKANIALYPYYNKTLGNIGQTFAHETRHALDYAFNKKLPPRYFDLDVPYAQRQMERAAEQFPLAILKNIARRSLR